MSGRSVNLTTLFLGRLIRPPKRSTSTSCTYLRQFLTTALLEKSEGETEVCCQTGYRTLPGPLTYESATLPIALRGPAVLEDLMVGCFGYNGPLRQYFSLYWAVSQRKREIRERIDESKNVQTTPPAPTASAIGPCPTVIKIVGFGWLVVLGLTAR